MKKLALVFAVVFLLTSCFTIESASKSESEVPTKTKTYKIGIALNSDSESLQYQNDFVDYLKAYESGTVKFKVSVLDTKKSIADQAANTDIVLLDIDSASLEEDFFAKIEKSGTSCIFLNREPSSKEFKSSKNSYFVGSNFLDEGIAQGSIVLSLHDKGDINKDGKVAFFMLEGDSQDPVAQSRTMNAVKALTDAGVKVECIDDCVAEWNRSKARQITAQVMKQYGDRIEVVFCNDDEMAMGALTSVRLAGKTVGKDIYVLGIGATQEAQDLVKSGELTGTVLRNFKDSSLNAVELVIKLANGESVEKYNWIDYQMIK